MLGTGSCDSVMAPYPAQPCCILVDLAVPQEREAKQRRRVRPLRMSKNRLG
jgi:hypothetical protein